MSGSISKKVTNARKLVNRLFRDLDDRQGFDTGGLDEDTLKEWKDKWVNMLARSLDSEWAKGYDDGYEDGCEATKEAL